MTAAINAPHPKEDRFRELSRKYGKLTTVMMSDTDHSEPELTLKAKIARKKDKKKHPTHYKEEVFASCNRDGNYFTQRESGLLSEEEEKGAVDMEGREELGSQWYNKPMS